MSGFMDNWLLRRAMSAPRGPKGYIQFVDPAVEAICVANYSSDGIGVTYADAAAVTSLGGKFKGNTSIVSFEELQYFTGSNAITSSEQFMSCTSLARLMLPDNTTSIGSYDLYNCPALTELTLPAGVTRIWVQALSGTGLLKLVSLPTTPPTLDNFWGFSASCKIYVPYSSDHSILAEYQAATNWSSYSSQMYELNPDGTIPTT